MYDKLNMIYVEIPKLKKKEEELNSHLEWWLYVFQNLNHLQNIPKSLRGDVIEKVFDKAEFINLPKVEQDKYHKNLKVYRDLLNSFETAEKEGHKRGKIEGRIEGKIEGEKLKSIEIAKASLAQNISIETIALITGLSEEEIGKL